MNADHTIFEKTLSGLSQGVQVKHIASYDLQSCSPDDIICEVLANYAEFDQIPVKENGYVIGVVERNGSSAGDDLVRNQMRRLDDQILVSEELSLLEFIPLMVGAPYYRLVLVGNRVNGVVTRSDLLKLPVRLLAFARITQLEMTMAELIRFHWPDNDEWIDLLKEPSQKSIRRFQKSAKKYRSDPPLLEFSSFKDKGTILQSVYQLEEGFSTDLEDLYNLRNSVAHAGNYAENEEMLTGFIQKLDSVDRWITEINSIVQNFMSNISTSTRR